MEKQQTIEKEKAIELVEKIYKIARDDIFDEVYQDVFQNKEIKKKLNEVAEELYDKVPYEVVEKMIKKSLPLRIRLFNKVKVCGKMLLNEDVIIYRYYFNNNFGKIFCYQPCIVELEKESGIDIFLNKRKDLI